MVRFIAATMLLLVPLATQAYNLPLNTLRVWQNTENQTQLEARCLWIKEGHLFLEPLEGKVQVWNLEAIGAEDQEFLANHLQYIHDYYQSEAMSNLDIPFTVYVAELKGAFWFPFCASCWMVFSLASTVAGRQWWLAFASLSAGTSAFMGLCFMII